MISNCWKVSLIYFAMICTSCAYLSISAYLCNQFFLARELIYISLLLFSPNLPSICNTEVPEKCILYLIILMHLYFAFLITAT